MKTIFEFSISFLFSFIIFLDYNNVTTKFSNKVTSLNYETNRLLTNNKKKENIKALNLLQNTITSKTILKETELNKQIKMLTKGVSSLNIVPADDTGLINLKLSGVNNIYSFGLEKKVFKISLNDDKIIELSKENSKLYSQNIILNTVSILGKIIYKYSYKVFKEVNASSSNNLSKNNNKSINSNQKVELVEINNKQAQWRMYMSDNFSLNNTSLGWNYSYTTKCGKYYNILGGVYQISQNTLEKVISYLPIHSSIMIEMNVHFLGKWNGETLYIQIDTNEAKFDPKYIWSMRCENSKNKPVFRMCDDYDYCKVGEKVRVSFNHFSNYIKIIVGSTLQTTPNEKSFGISDFRLYVK